jgi:hypothetical protein
MNGTMYTLMTYGLTAMISLAVVGLIVIINKLMGGNSDTDNEQETD